MNTVSCKIPDALEHAANLVKLDRCADLIATCAAQAAVIDNANERIKRCLQAFNEEINARYEQEVKHQRS